MTIGESDRALCAVFELREDGGNLHGVMLQEGRAAKGGRAEVFAPGSVEWPSQGVAIIDGHKGPELARAIPDRSETGELRVTATATDAIRAAIQSGRRYMSIEFRALAESRTAAGVREITRAIVHSAALVASPRVPRDQGRGPGKGTEAAGMALITLAQFAADIRVIVPGESFTSDHEDYQQVKRAYDAAKALVNGHAPDAPEAIRNVAIPLTGRLLYEGDGHYGDVMRVSGAAGLLAEWKPRTALVCGD